ncbi:MAG: enoyl-CoA hydratase [Ilumatobacteraceae bacterium]
MLVEQGAGTVGEGFFGELVEALVGHFDGVFGVAVEAVEVTDLDGQSGAFHALVADQRTGLGHRWFNDGRRRLGDQSLHPEHHLHLDRRLPIENLIDAPTAVCSLAPAGPIEVDVGNDARWLPLAGQAVRGLPRQIAEKDVDLEVFVERLTLEKGSLEGVSERADRIGEHMVEHQPLTLPCQNYGVAMSLVDVSHADGVATLTLNNPAERNTLTMAMVEEIVKAMDQIERDETIGAIVVTGAPPAFCAGANLGNLAEAGETSLGAIYEGFLRIARSPLPTLAAVNGAAVGAGMNLALGCDVRLAARRAKFDTRFLQIGLHPGGGHTWMLRRIAGPQVAMAAVVFGEVMDGEEAARVGLAHRCVDDDQLLEVAQVMAARAASAPRDLAIEAKKTIQAMADIDNHPAAVERELEPQLWSTRQPWFAERLAALQEKIRTKP